MAPIVSPLIRDVIRDLVVFKNYFICTIGKRLMVEGFAVVGCCWPCVNYTAYTMFKEG